MKKEYNLYWVGAFIRMQHEYHIRDGTTHMNAVDFIHAFADFAMDEERKQEEWLNDGNISIPGTKDIKTFYAKKATDLKLSKEKKNTSVLSVTDTT